MPKPLLYHLKPPENISPQSSHYPLYGKSMGIFQKLLSSWSPPRGQGRARVVGFCTGHLAGGATQKVPVIRSQLLELHLANRSCLGSWSPLGKWDALPLPCGRGGS